MGRKALLAHDLQSVLYTLKFRHGGHSAFFFCNQFDLAQFSFRLIGLRLDRIELDMQDPDQYGLHAKLKETDDPEGVTLSRELQETLERAIEALPDDLRTAIILRELDGMSYEEIAQTMDCPVGTVRSRIFRARDAIGKKVGTLVR